MGDEHEVAVRRRDRHQLAEGRKLGFAVLWVREKIAECRIGLRFDAKR